MTMSYVRADKVLDESLVTGTAYLWLHTGNPGADGTANVAQVDANNIVKKFVDFSAPVNHEYNAERACYTSTQVEWTGLEIDDGQLITHFSLWDSDGVGAAVEYIAEVAHEKTVGMDGVVVEIGDIEVAITVHQLPN